MLLIGGNVVFLIFVLNGYFVELIIFIDCVDDMIIVKEEIFGLVMSVLVFDDEDEVIVCVNDIELGLVVGVFSKDIQCVYCVIYQF